MRGIAQGKSRLAGRLDRGERARLNRLLLARTLAVITMWQGGFGRCIVVSSCARALRIAQRAGALPLLEPQPGGGLNRAIAYAARRAVRCGARAVANVSSDLPLLSARALDALVAPATCGHRVVIAPDAPGTGTNALLLHTRARFESRFGPQSCARHVEAARSRGWRFSICTHPDLALDIDVPQDLAAWRARRRRA